MVQKNERRRLPIGQRFVLFLDSYFGGSDGNDAGEDVEPKPETQTERRLRIQAELLRRSSGSLSDPRPWSLELWR